MCNLFVRSYSRINCLMRKLPAVNGRSAAYAADASAAVFNLICLSQTMHIAPAALQLNNVVHS